MSEPATPNPPPPMAGAELLEQLRTALDRAGELARVLEANIRETQAGPGGKHPDDLSERLATAEADVHELSTRLVRSEQQAGLLMNLYAATYQLHSSLEPEVVRATIAEIVINLLGAESFALLLDRTEGGFEIALREGISPDQHPLYAGDTYSGGDPMVDATLADGGLRMGPTAESAALAAVPLRIHNDTVGAVVLLQLFGHKPQLRAEDRDLLDMLSAHAASALFAARLFAAKDRKLKTLESLFKLARGE